MSLATARTRGRAASLALAWTVVSCSSYVGRAEQRDAGGVVATDHGPPRDLPPTGDRGPARLVCGDYAFACHPLTNEGCGAGLACVIDTLLPRPRGAPRPVEGGSVSAATRGYRRCAAPTGSSVWRGAACARAARPTTRGVAPSTP
nr:hypothetical protein [Deltaproteobacteria bacterium]